ncbi:DUF3987 domain-containing protein [Falsiroseomonas sp. HW251]|uniref:DUF3987 domain-containing protein n=1 Tax=Falsiroseomonas sp. HW251 TaxID=3390998 RepID=UPI003D316996
MADDFATLFEEAKAQLGSGAWGEPDRSVAIRDAMPTPPWPQHLFVGDWGSYIEETAATTSSPPDYVGLGLFEASAALIGNARWGSPRPGWAEPTVLWGAAVGRPSSSKTPPLLAVMNVVRRIEVEANNDWEDRRAGHRKQKEVAKLAREQWEADVRSAMKDRKAAPDEPKESREPEPLSKRRFISTDTTTEKAARLSATNPLGLINYRDELAGWLSSMDRYSGAAGADRAFWLQAWNGTFWTKDRVKDGEDEISVRHLSWSIVGGITPDRLASLMLSGDDDGLSARFLYVWPDAQEPTDLDVEPPTHILLDALRKLAEIEWDAPEPTILQFTPEARSMMLEWRKRVFQMAQDATGIYGSWLGKLPGMALRLSVIFAHLTATGLGVALPQEVNADDLRRACEFLADYAIPMTKRTFGQAVLPVAEQDARALARWYLRQPPPRPRILNARALVRTTNGLNIPTPERMEAALVNLAEADTGWCRRVTASGPAGGRPRKDFEVNPKLLGEGGS